MSHRNIFSSLSSNVKISNLVKRIVKLLTAEKCTLQYKYPLEVLTFKNACAERSKLSKLKEYGSNEREYAVRKKTEELVCKESAQVALISMRGIVLFLFLQLIELKIICNMQKKYIKNKIQGNLSIFIKIVIRIFQKIKSDHCNRIFYY